ncbi:hypothetical protein E2320_018105 [Naja naja]|nr:hypothetical protein E2320_018105 [Naja naja]
MLELDCHLTKDEQVVVLHDENLKQSTGVDANISDLKYSELPLYHRKLEVTFQKECHCEGEDKRIPLLQEVFEAFPHTPVNIDIKVNNDLLIKKVSNLVSSYKREHLTVWGSVSHEVVYIWVLNEDHEYKRAFDLGATGVMTDYPTKLKEFLHNYPA